MRTSFDLGESMAAARTRLDDLQAEVEASARCAERLYEEVGAGDPRARTHSQESRRLETLTQSIRELRISIAEQRALLRELRASLEDVRKAIRRNREARHLRTQGSERGGRADPA